MRYEELEIGNAAILNRTLSELFSETQSIRSAFFVSPFVELASNARPAAQIRQFLRQAKRDGAEAALLSDYTPARSRDFKIALATERDLEGSLYLAQKLHAKCGLVTFESGFQLGWLGSANLTESGLSQNLEVMLGLVNHCSGSTDHQLCTDLEIWIRNTLVQSTMVTLERDDRI